MKCWEQLGLIIKARIILTEGFRKKNNNNEKLEEREWEAHVAGI